ncbi:MAG: Iron-sulfur cluster insertion protein ErpA [Pseudomonadales bacterium]|nr:Iron-sulfur cluster insertion protein ErpA [Pseudomonadales bacterium]
MMSQAFEAGAAQTFTPSPLRVTERAVAKIRELIEDEDNPALKLRVYVTGGGCSGFQYGFAFEEALADDDTVIEKGGIGVVVDALSYPYLVGSEVDYSEGLEGSRFVVRNPNATATCGCGSSFSM